MAESSNSEKSLLESETIRNQVIPYIQEEILLPTVAEESSDIEILEENITEKTLKKKRKNKLKNDLHKIKKLHSSQDALTDVCGLQVTIKSLLKNDEIRKQIAPFIEEVVIDCTDSDTEENNTSTTSVRKVNNELTDEQILDKAKDVIAKSLTKLKKKSKPKKQKHISNNLKANNKAEANNKSEISEKVHVLDLTDDISDDDVNLSERVKNKTLTKKSKTKKLASLSKPNQNSVILENNCEGLIINENIFVIDGLQQSHENTEPKHDIPDLPITESDDWYYLNIARAPKYSSIEDDILIIQNSLKLNESSNNIEEEELLLSSPSDKIETEKFVNGADNYSNKIETEKPVNDAVIHVPHRKRRRQKKNRWNIYGNRSTRKNIESLKALKSNVKNINDKEKSSLSVNTENQIANLKSENSVLKYSLATNEIEDQTAGFENGITENGINSKGKRTYSHELIPIIKKEAESIDNSCSETPQCTDVNTSINKIDLNDDCSFNNGGFKPMLKPYRIKEITPDFYRDEEKVYKTYQKISARRNTRLMNIQNRLTKTRSASYKDKTCFKKRARFTVRCSKCGKKYERTCFLRRHEEACKADETVKTDFQCSQCPFKTPWKYTYQTHVATHLVDPKLVRSYETQMLVRCTVCPIRRGANQRGNKCIKCHSYYEYVCRMCGKDYTTYTNLKMHVLRNIQLGHGRTCHKCGRGGYISLCALKKHVRECETLQENQGKVICKKIPYVRLVRHEDESKESHQMNIHCSNCDIFSTTSERQAKCETCHADVSYKCELCNEFLPSYSDLQSHVLNIHIMNTEMSLENKNEATEDLERKNGCDEINYSCDSNVQADGDKQPLGIEKGVATDYNSPNKQKSKRNLTKKGVQKLDTFDNFVDNLKEKNKIFQGFEADDVDNTDESDDGMNKVLVPKCSEYPSIKIQDATLTDIVNSNLMKEKTCDSRLNEECVEDGKGAQSSSLKQQLKTSGIKRYCLRCDKTKKDLDVIRMGSKKEICEKCKSELIYQCVKCKRKSNNYSVMLYHWKHYCAFLLPKYSTVKLTTPEKYKNSNSHNRIQRHQCRLCPYSSNLKNRLMLHLQMHSWKDIKSAVLESENSSNNPSNTK